MTTRPRTASRKQREIEEREELILTIARDMLLTRGYLGLTMDRIADATEYSKGTIYQHFRCKEDLLAGLLLRSCALRGEFFERAATFAGGSRARMTAVGVADELLPALYPHHSAIEAVLKTASIREKASPAHREAIRRSEQRILGVLFDIVRDGLANGDLVLPDGDTVQSVAFGLWSMHFGGRQIAQMDLPFADLGFGEPREMLARSAQVFLDGLAWQPLSSTFDAHALRRRVLEQVFPEEGRAAGMI